VPLFIPRTNGLFCWWVHCVLCKKFALHSNHRLNRVIFPTHKTTSPPERPFSHYVHSHRLATEMWTTMKNNLLGEKNWVVPSNCTDFGNTFPRGFPTINLCNPGVSYETPCIFYKL
jgi:hypothetical protein